MYEQELLVTVGQARTSCNHYQDFLSHDLQSEHECGTCVMVLRHILAVLCDVSYHGLHARLTSILWIFTCGDI
jgi:hypothetical protein